MFIPIADSEFELAHVGLLGGDSDSIHVMALANPMALSLREFKQQRFGSGSLEKVEENTFAGLPALRVTYEDRGSGRASESFLVATGGYMWYIGHQLSRGNSTLADRDAMVRSFRFLTADEVRTARAAATAAPAPRSPEQVADILAEGLTKKDVAMLARVTYICLATGPSGAGPTNIDAQTYLAQLRQRFVQGLVVEVRARPVEALQGGMQRIRSTWREPGKPDLDTDLWISLELGTAYWRGTVWYPQGRP